MYDQQQVCSNSGQGIPQGIPEPTPIPPMGNKIKGIRINEVSRGFVVEVGCQTFVFETKEALLLNLSKYVNDPEITEKKWFTGELFK